MVTEGRVGLAETGKFAPCLPEAASGASHACSRFQQDAELSYGFDGAPQPLGG